MPAGLQVINSSGILQIDETYRNLVLRSKVTVTGGVTTVSISNAVNPVIALRSTASPGMCIAKTTPGTTYSWDVFGSGSVYIFDTPLTPPVHGSGMQVFAADGSCAFDSTYEYFKPVQYEYWQPNATITTQDLTSPMGAGYGDQLVHQPSGAAWACAIIRPGIYTYYTGNTYYGVRSIYNASSNTFTVTKYQTGVLAGGGSQPATSSGFLSILFVDVTGF